MYSFLAVRLRFQKKDTVSCSSCSPNTVLVHSKNCQWGTLLSYWDYCSWNWYMRDKQDDRLKDILQWGSITYAADMDAVFHFFNEWTCDSVRVWAHSCVVSVVSLCMYRDLSANVSVHMPGCPCRHQRTIFSSTLFEIGSPCCFSGVLPNLVNAPEL